MKLYLLMPAKSKSSTKQVPKQTSKWKYSDVAIFKYSNQKYN